MRLAILGSTRGTHLQSIFQAIQEKKLAATIEIVLSNKQDAGILERAKNYHLNYQFVNPKGLTRAEFDAEISKILEKYKIDLIVLVGYMRILSDEFVTKWENKIINVHPSLLPKHAGLMDLAVHQAVLDAGETETGCTVHYVSHVVDAGPILVKKKCEVLADDTVNTLKSRVQQLEAEALKTAINIVGIQLSS